jgi:hypothetical protein
MRSESNIFHDSINHCRDGGVVSLRASQPSPRIRGPAFGAQDCAVY